MNVRFLNVSRGAYVRFKGNELQTQISLFTNALFPFGVQYWLDFSGFQLCGVSFTLGTTHMGWSGWYNSKKCCLKV